MNNNNFEFSKVEYEKAYDGWTVWGWHDQEGLWEKLLAEKWEVFCRERDGLFPIPGE